MGIKIKKIKFLNTKAMRHCLSFLFIFLLIFLSSSFLLSQLNKNRIVWGLKVNNLTLGGKNITKTKAEFEQLINNFLNHEIILKYQNKTWAVSPKELGIKIDVEATLKQAKKIGHQSNIFTNYFQQFFALVGLTKTKLIYQVNEKKIDDYINTELASVNKPAINASWKYDESSDDFIMITSKKGVIIDKFNFKNQLFEKIESLDMDKEIQINLIEDIPEVLESETQDAYIKAKNVLQKTPYSLIVEIPSKENLITVPLTKDDLLFLLEFKPIVDTSNPENKILGVTLNRNSTEKYLTSISPLINQPPINAKLDIRNGRVVAFSLSQEGIALSIKENVNVLRKEIIEKGNKKIKLRVSIISPKISTKSINNLGITSLLGKGTSNFSGSPPNRIHNIKIGAEKFNGLLIKPGDEFSFNEILGEIGPEQGYKPELVIKKNITIPEYGGGLCQVSTTLFRTAVNAGLPITERYPHAFPVKYYNPQGFDATIYPPHPDLRFINDTPNHILIQSKIQGNTLIFEIYGTDDGRVVKIDGPHQYDVKPDGSLKAVLTRKIYKNGKLIKEDVFHSSYKSPDLYPVVQRNPLE